MKLSRYVVKSVGANGEGHVFFNIRTGRGVKVPSINASSLLQIAEKNKKLGDFLRTNKFTMTENEDEEVFREYQHWKAGSPFHLILLPHENCNFRCVYCYEKFEKNAMLPWVEDGIIKLIEKRLSMGMDKIFLVSWFGGEPLLAKGVIKRMSEKIIKICDKYGVRYAASITTNGYLLDKNTIKMLTDSRVKHYQITIDGEEKSHDQQRRRVNGAPTYQKIITNLQEMSALEDQFEVLIRMNVGPSNLQEAESHIRKMKEFFGNDSRFKLLFHKIEKLGGPHDEDIEVCTSSVVSSLLSLSNRIGMKSMEAFDYISPNHTCYASSPNSFVIGSDGLVYKCTVALYEEFNQVGVLRQDGELQLSAEKMRLWTNLSSEDNVCKSCFMAPSCHGDSCPLIRIKTGRRPCPDAKREIREYVTLMDEQHFGLVDLRNGIRVS